MIGQPCSMDETGQELVSAFHTVCWSIGKVLEKLVFFTKNHYLKSVSTRKNCLRTQYKYNICKNDLWWPGRRCCGSGSVCFGPSGSWPINIWYGFGSESGFSINKQKSKKNLDFYYFVNVLFGFFIYEIWCKCTLKK